MFRNYFTIGIRNLTRHKVYSFIHVAGLVIGMACCMLILLYVQHELHYDRFHEKGDRIYRVLRETQNENGKIDLGAGISGAFTSTLLKDFPEIEDAVRVTNTFGRFVQSGEKQLAHPFGAILSADPNFLRVFNFKLIQGDQELALRDPYSVIMAEKTARRYFGNEDPIGKMITFADGRFRGDYKITGVVRIPEQSSIQFEMMCPLYPSMIVNSFFKNQLQSWQGTSINRPVNVFVVLREGIKPNTLNIKLPDFIERYMGKEVREGNKYYFQPLHRMHLYTESTYGNILHGDLIQASYGNNQIIYLFSAIAFLILLIACVNFMNLATARSVNRAKEVGLRKVSGAHRLQLIQQFLGEAVFLSFLSFLLAFGIVELVLPKFCSFIGKDLMPVRSFYHLLSISGLVTFIGLLAGIYPAFFLSSFEPVTMLKGQLRTGFEGLFLRKCLVVFQFSMSIMLIIGTMMIYQQLNFIQNKNLGFQKSHLITLDFFTLDKQKKSNDPEAWLSRRYDTIKETFLRHPSVLAATAYRSSLGTNGGMMRWVRSDTDGFLYTRVQEADEDFSKAMGIDLVAGRTFHKEEMTEEPRSALLNEKAVEMFGLDDPIGKQLSWGRDKVTVVGVMKDFHNRSLHEDIEPLIIWNRHTHVGMLSVRVRGDNLQHTITFLEQTWKRFLPDRPFHFEFMDERLNQLYIEDQKNGQLVGAFAFLAIVVACLGLFGLATFTAEQRTKEIGVRKVLGASVQNIVVLLSKDFVKLVLVANLIAYPVAYLAVSDWLQNFAYRVDLSWWIFALGGMFAMLIALGTVGYQAMSAALSNPINALRQE